MVAIACLALPVAGIVTKAAAGASNVDDYLYAGLARQFGNALWQHLFTYGRLVLHSGPYSPLFLVVASLWSAQAVSTYLATLAQLPFLGLLFVSVRGLAGAFGDRRPTLIALLVLGSPAIVGWAVMVHFAIAATACTALVLWTYLRSDSFRSQRISILVGIAAGALLLTRSLAPVYLVAAATGIAVHLALGRRTGFSRRGLLLAVAVCGVVAAPWWFRSGSATLAYLLTSGFDPSSGFVSQGDLLFRVTNRLAATLADWGPLTSCVLLVLLAAWLTGLAATRFREQREQWPARAALLATLLSGFALLAMSGNSGTAFSLPFLPIAILTVSAGFAWGRRLDVVHRAIVTAAAAVLFTASVGVAVGQPIAWANPPWRSLLAEAGWAPGEPGPDAIHRTIVQAAAGAPMLIVRDDELFNYNGYAYTVGTLHPSILVGRVAVAPYGIPGWQPEATDLVGQPIVVAGRTAAPFHQLLDEAQVEVALERLGYVQSCRMVLNAANEIDLWTAPGRSLACPQVPAPD